jgi:hypothetical protein
MELRESSREASHHHPKEWYQNCWLYERGIKDGAASVDVLAKLATSSSFV